MRQSSSSSSPSNLITLYPHHCDTVKDMYISPELCIRACLDTRARGVCVDHLTMERGYASPLASRPINFSDLFRPPSEHSHHSDSDSDLARGSGSMSNSEPNSPQEGQDNHRYPPPGIGVTIHSRPTTASPPSLSVVAAQRSPSPPVMVAPALSETPFNAIEFPTIPSGRSYSVSPALTANTDFQQLEAPVSPRPKPSRHSRFYFDDELVTLFVEGTLFRVHKYFLVRESDFFRDMFHLPQPRGPGGIEGQSDEKPIHLPGVTLDEMESFLGFLYFGMHDDHETSLASWTSLLSFSTRLQCPKLRARAIEVLTSFQPPIDPVDKIVMAVRYDIPRWLRPAYAEIATREEPLEVEEAERLGLATSVRLAKVRETVRRRDWERRMMRVRKTMAERSPKDVRKIQFVPPPSSPVGEDGDSDTAEVDGEFTGSEVMEILDQVLGPTSG